LRRGAAEASFHLGNKQHQEVLMFACCYTLLTNVWNDMPARFPLDQSVEGKVTNRKRKQEERDKTACSQISFALPANTRPTNNAASQKLPQMSGPPLDPVLCDFFPSRNLPRVDPKSDQPIRPAKEGMTRTVLGTMQPEALPLERRKHERQQALK